MKLSAVYTLTEKPLFEAAISAPLKPTLKLMAELGYEGLEVNLPNPFKVDELRLLATLRQYGLNLSAVSTGLSHIAYGLSLTHPSHQTRKKTLIFLKRYAELAWNLGCNYVVLGLIKGRLEGRPKTQVEKLLKQTLEELLAETEDYQTVYLVEPINRRETDFINTVEEALQIAETHPERTRILADTYHLNLEGNLHENIRKIGAHLGYVHVADTGRLPPGLGRINWRKLVSQLKNTGYRGYLSLEALPKPSYTEALRKTAETLKPLITDPQPHRPAENLQNEDRR